MGEKLQVSWRGEVFEVDTCLTPERKAVALELWSGGVVEIERVIEAGRKSPFTMAERSWLVRVVLRAAGEPLPHSPTPWAARAVAGASVPLPVVRAAPAAFGPAVAVARRVPAEREPTLADRVAELARGRAPQTRPAMPLNVRKVG